MIPASFEYERVGSVDEAIASLSSDQDAKILAGGHSLLPLMKLRLARPSKLVDIGRISELSYVREDPDAVAIGAHRLRTRRYNVVHFHQSTLAARVGLFVADEDVTRSVCAESVEKKPSK